MSGAYFLIDFMNNDINNIIKQPLKHTQRIKYTCFNVSKNYLIFGSLSGGLYVFTRNPCEFLKLVPTKEGAISNIAIAPNEKAIAAGTEKGSVILIEHCFTDCNYKHQVYNEHKGYIITALIWNFNDLYCGDSSGKVSAISNIGSLTKTIFHNPITILMNLDSRIVQLDVYYKYLLASTETKTYLCDTDFEQYRQIGKKVRKGEFGACFYAVSPSQKVALKSKDRSIFKILKDDEIFATEENLEGVKIYCTRPGLRIWEADFNASVICTHQFKTSLHEVKSELVSIDRSKADANLKLTVSGDVHGIVNFSKIIVTDNFFITFGPNLLMIFDSEMKLIFKCKSIIKDVKVVKNYIYLWNSKDIKMMALMDLEMLLAEALNNKQFYMCAQISLKYKDELKNIKMNLSSILKDKLQGNKILSQLEPHLEKLQKQASVSNGIVTVDNGYVREGCSSHKENHSEPDEISEKAKDEPLHVEDQTEKSEDTNYVTNIIFRQYQVNKMNEKLKLPQFKELLIARSLDVILAQFKQFEEYISKLEPDDNNVSEWCYNQFVDHLKDENLLKGLDKDSLEFNYILEMFIKYNGNSSLLCSCGFPLPNAKNNQPKFYDVGCELIQKKSDIYKSVPYMYKNHIESTFTKNINLPLLVQFSDIDLFCRYSKKFTYDLWDESVRKLIKYKQKKCLNCDKAIEFDSTATISWKQFALSMIKSIGGVNTVELLKKYSKYIDNSELGVQFYQLCIFSEITGEHEKSTTFVETINGKQDQFELSLKKFLSNKHAGDLKGKDVIKPNQKCSKCDLVINSAILEHCTLVCGHQYHNICLIGDVCSICDI
ncbi:PREDICTED: Hermansky-Pudlak syndrome 5 protein homolog [Nicrophorus vespilloides]|uniref:Hermansky-Pudlak syndrome 5 protein homolog n=1 Tax=Nicrophorus vespilloides TaxID=110193 RepID=A0ABM1NH92_NICVS|nr:PREDICTED: Hermansky-Pudlak syndrome 5 protein homolog [Nicrophorus vespilloides]